MPMQSWFREAKLGIFVHYGIYAVDGVDESWSFYTGQVTYEQYMNQRHGFTAARYDPRAVGRPVRQGRRPVRGADRPPP